MLIVIIWSMLKSVDNERDLNNEVADLSHNHINAILKNDLHKVGFFL